MNDTKTLAQVRQEMNLGWDSARQVIAAERQSSYRKKGNANME
jgi:hypothetical protein